MVKVSVIVPMYNDEEYLRQCIESIINQTIGFKNIQAIFIDDNSKDKSYDIALEYQNKYPENIILKKLDVNSGSGGKPRNVGIDLAVGKYLMFSDADDFFASDAFEKMYNHMEEKKADFIISNWNYTDVDGNLWEKPVFDKDRFKEFKLSIYDYDKSFYVMNSSMCNKIFNREFINKYNIRCLEGVPGEDTYFSMSAFLNAENVYYVEDITYFYRQRNTLYKEASISWNCSKNFFEGMNIAYKKLYELFVKHKQVNFYRFIYARNMTYLLYRFIDSNKLSREEKIEVFSELKWFFELSYTLKVPAVQKSLTVLIDKIIEEDYEEAMDIGEIIAELRTYLPNEIRNKMSKPYEEMYKEILKEKVEV